AARRARPAGDEGFRLLDADEDAGNALVEAEAGFGQRYLPCRALEEPRAKALLQPLDALGDHGGREAKRAAGRRHAAHRGHAREDFQVAQVRQKSDPFSPFWKKCLAFAWPMVKW